MKKAIIVAGLLMTAQLVFGGMAAEVGIYAVKAATELQADNLDALGE